METRKGKADKHKELIDQKEQKKMDEVKIKLKRVPKGIVPDVCRAQGIQPRRSDWRTSSRTGHIGHGASGVYEAEL